MEDFKSLGGGVNVRQADSEHVEVAKDEENSAVLDEGDLEDLSSVGDGAIIVGDSVVADPNSSSDLVTLREADGTHIVTISQSDDVEHMLGMLTEDEVEAVLVSARGAKVHITDMAAVNVKADHGGCKAELKAEFDDDVRHTDSPRAGNSQGSAEEYDRSWYFTEVREPQ